MLIYQIMLGVAALLALLMHRPDVQMRSTGLAISLAVFGLFYSLVSALRSEVGGDWFAYLYMLGTVRLGGLGEALTATDPGFGLLLYLGDRLGGDIYLVNGVCSAILFYGVARAGAQTREPWLAVTVAVPYLLIVVGMGYVRQAAAIGFVLAAIDAVRRERIVRALGMLLGATMFHSTAIVTWPLFAVALANRNPLRYLFFSTAGVAAMWYLILSRLGEFGEDYLGDAYESGGALVRLLMGVVPSLLLLVSFRRFQIGGRARSIWIGFAIANILALVAFFLSPSSAAVDRVALYFTGVQLVAFGSIGDLLGFSPRSRIILRLLVITYAVATMLVWLTYATHAEAWVPYKSVVD
jgi:energy-converting hydrogenase Eha subunit E